MGIGGSREKWFRAQTLALDHLAPNSSSTTYQTRYLTSLCLTFLICKMGGIGLLMKLGVVN